MIKFKRGNLIFLTQQGHYDVVMQGLNCHCKMSDGIALQFARTFPAVQEADLKTRPRDKNKLGTFVPVPLQVGSRQVTVLNCYTQFNYAGFDVEEVALFDYAAFERILKAVALQYRKKKIAMPLIGSGHAGGDTQRIVSLIKQHLKHHDVSVIVYGIQGEHDVLPELDSWCNNLKCFLSL